MPPLLLCHLQITKSGLEAWMPMILYTKLNLSLNVQNTQEWIYVTRMLVYNAKSQTWIDHGMSFYKHIATKRIIK